MKRILFTSSLLLAFTIGALWAATFQVTPPDGWKQKDGAAAAQYMKGSASFIVTIDTMPADARTPDAYIAFVKKQLTKAFGKVEFISVTSVSYAGVDGRELVYTTSAYGLAMKYDVVYLFKNGKAYTLTGGALKTEFDGILPDLNKFVKSFSFK